MTLLTLSLIATFVVILEALRLSALRAQNRELRDEVATLHAIVEEVYPTLSTDIQDTILALLQVEDPSVQWELHAQLAPPPPQGQGQEIHH